MRSTASNTWPRSPDDRGSGKCTARFVDGDRVRVAVKRADLCTGFVKS